MKNWPDTRVGAPVILEKEGVGQAKPKVNEITFAFMQFEAIEEYLPHNTERIVTDILRCARGIYSSDDKRIDLCLKEFCRNPNAEG